MRATASAATSCMLLAMFVGAAAAKNVKLSGPSIISAISDHTYQSAKNGHVSMQIFQKSGVTYYSVDGAQSQGQWAVRGDQYCSQWPPNESWRCFDVVQNGDKIAFVSAGGKRLEMKRAN